MDDLGDLDADAAAVIGLLDRRMRAGDGPTLLAIAGPPGSGKSTLGARVVDRLNAGAGPSGPARLVPMDGFHLDNALLDARGLRAVKGAPETFDAAGFVALIRTLRSARGETRYPLFDRGADRVVPDAAAVPAGTRVIVVEGNYLLLQGGAWSALATLFDATVMLAPALATLEKRLVSRWLAHGLPPERARARARGNDLPNARRVLENSADADLRLPDPRTRHPG